MSDGDRTLLVDASVFITLSQVGTVELVNSLSGDVVVPGPVAEEITSSPADDWLEAGVYNGWIQQSDWVPKEDAALARSYLGRSDGEMDGDIALLAIALASDSPVVVSDDKPLRQTCKSLSIPVSGSIGVLVQNVELGELSPEEAKDRLYAIDETGARLSASLVKRAEKLIDEASD